MKTLLLKRLNSQSLSPCPPLLPDDLICMASCEGCFLRNIVSAKPLKKPFLRRQSRFLRQPGPRTLSHEQSPLPEQGSRKKNRPSTGDSRDAVRSQRPRTRVKAPSPLQQAELLDALKKLKPRKKSELSKRGVVRVIYHATMDKETCPLCAYLDGMVMDPDDPATDIFSPPLFPGCTCRREYVLKTEKPSKWPPVTFTFPPQELLVYLQKKF